MGPYATVARDTYRCFNRESRHKALPVFIVNLTSYRHDDVIMARWRHNVHCYAAFWYLHSWETSLVLTPTRNYGAYFTTCEFFGDPIHASGLLNFHQSREHKVLRNASTISIDDTVWGTMRLQGTVFRDSQVANDDGLIILLCTRPFPVQETMATRKGIAQVSNELGKMTEFL